MIRRLVNAAGGFVIFCVLLYFFFFVPLGRRTLYEHVTRIAETEEAQDLGEDVDVAAERLEGAVREQIGEDASDAGRPDAAR